VRAGLLLPGSHLQSSASELAEVAEKEMMDYLQKQGRLNRQPCFYYIIGIYR